MPLHVHSDFSLLDGASQLPQLVSRASELGVPALALTDHGVLYGAIQLVRTCASTKVKPIIGNEMYVVNCHIPYSTEQYGPHPKKYHLVVLAKNTQGYRNLVKLTTMAHLDGKIGKGIFARPCISKHLLYKYREGLIVSSACLGGEIPQAILNEDISYARTVASWFRDVFGDDFYLEIQDHGSREDKKVNPVIIQLSEELNIKVLATNDSHFTNCLDAEAHDAMICIQTGKLLTDENRLHYAGNEYFKSVEEMRKCFVDHLPTDVVDDALYNTIAVASKVDTYNLFGATRIPNFPVPRNFDMSHDVYLRHVARESLRDRLLARKAAGLVLPEAESQYHDRLEFELDMLCEMGFSSYFLVVWDYIRYAKQLKIPVGPGRGSAAGSLVAFALRITDVDPIPFNLLFERFLNPERKSMPDIDTDFSVSGREKIIAYVSERYGTDRVAQIITFNRLTSKAVLKDVARVHSVPYAEADRLAKLIPVVRGKPATLSKLLEKDTPSPDFKKLIDKNPPYKVWLDKAKRLEGANKTYGIHAAGVVISSSPLNDIVPLSKAKHGEIITQYAMEDVESLGLLKMDFLGLKNLTVIETALEFINEGRRELGIEEDLDFSVDALPLDDANTYKLLSEGELDGIFQLDASAGMRSIVRELRPSSLEDISSILALYRPGPLDAGLIPKFIRRKHGIDPIEYDHPLLEPILKETYGIMVYQEQIMRIARDLAGYSLGQADILRRAMGKKKSADMEHEKPRFVEGAQQRGVSEKKAIELFDMMIKFAEYCFNKSHSTAYAYLTYQTAYLKANYPVEYSAALLKSNMNQSDKLARYLADANSLGVKVVPPSVNKSALGFTVDRSRGNEGVVLFGLEAVKTVGESVSHALLEERVAGGLFLSVIDVIERVNLRVLNKRAMASLIMAGAFDELHPNRKALAEQFESLLVLRRKLRDRRKRKEDKGISEEEKNTLALEERMAWEEAEVQLAKDCAEKDDFSLLETLAGEKASIGYYASGHPLYDLQDVATVLGCVRVDHITGDVGDKEPSFDEEAVCSSPSTIPDGAQVMILSCITELKRLTTSRGKKMAKWMIEDAASRVAGIVFPGAYDVVEQVIVPNETRAKELDFVGPNATESDPQNAKASHLVVEEDARVIVWGKVDRESSGTAQVIIDDVQRVEDVKCVIATSTYDEDRPSSLNVQILRDAAAACLNIDVGSKAGTYTDANGQIRRRKWTKSTPLAEKNRIPLILRCLNEDGEVISYTNAGNVVRLPLNCRNFFDSLEERTRFHFEMVSISDDILSKDGSNVLSKKKDVLASSSGTPIEAQDIGRNPLAKNLKNGIEEAHSVHSSSENAGDVNDSALTDVTKHSLLLPSNFTQEVVQNDIYNDVHSIPNIEGEQRVNEDYINRTGEHVLSKAEDIDSQESVPNETPIDRQSSNPLLAEQGGVEEGSIIRIGDVTLTKAEHEEYLLSVRGLRSEDAYETGSKADQALSFLRSRPYHRNTFHSDVFSPIHRLGDFSAHDEFEKARDNSFFSDGEVRKKSVSVSSSVSMTNVEDSFVEVVPLEGSMQRPPFGISNVSPDGKGSIQAGTASFDDSIPTPSSVPSKTSQSYDGCITDVTIAPQTREEREPADFVEVPSSAQTEADDFGSEHTIVKQIGNIVSSSSIDNRNETNTAALDDNEVIIPKIADVITSVIDVAEGLDLHVDSGKAAGILDAVCLVANGLAKKHCHSSCTFCAMTELDINMLSEIGASLHISGRIAFVVKHDIYVLVDVREKEPSGKRKRVRLFGPVTVLFKSLKALNPLPLKTKKSRKFAEAALQGLEKAASLENRTGAASGSQYGSGLSSLRDAYRTIKSSAAEISISKKYSQLEKCPVLSDGGQLLTFMCHAAKVCVDKALCVYNQARVVIIKNVLCSNFEVLAMDVASLSIRVHLDGNTFGIMRVQVDATVFTTDKKSTVCCATFGVVHGNSKKLKSIRIDVDEPPLFTEAEVARQFMLLSNTSRCKVRECD